MVVRIHASIGRDYMYRVHTYILHVYMDCGLRRAVSPSSQKHIGNTAFLSPPKNPREGIITKQVPLITRALRGKGQVYVRNLTAGTLTKGSSCTGYVQRMYRTSTGSYQVQTGIDMNLQMFFDVSIHTYCRISSSQTPNIRPSTK